MPGVFDVADRLKRLSGLGHQREVFDAAIRPARRLSQTISLANDTKIIWRFRRNPRV